MRLREATAALPRGARASQRGTTSASALDRVLITQRLAGNRAVSAALQRDEQRPPPPTLAEVAARHKAVSAKARAMCTKHWKQSHEETAEYGGIIWQRGGEYGYGPIYSEPGASVKLHQYDPNAGCPAGTIPVAYWHTHPYDADPLTHAPREEKDGLEAFSPEDLTIARDYLLDPFVLDKFGFHDLPAEAWHRTDVAPSWYDLTARSGAADAGRP